MSNWHMGFADQKNSESKLREAFCPSNLLQSKVSTSDSVTKPRAHNTIAQTRTTRPSTLAFKEHVGSVCVWVLKNLHMTSEKDVEDQRGSHEKKTLHMLNAHRESNVGLVPPCPHATHTSTIRRSPCNGHCACVNTATSTTASAAAVVADAAFVSRRSRSHEVSVHNCARRWKRNCKFARSDSCVTLGLGSLSWSSHLPAGVAKDRTLSSASNYQSCYFFSRGWSVSQEIRKILARCLLMAMIASLTSRTLKIHNRNTHSMFFHSCLEHLCASSSMPVLLPKAAFAFASLYTTGSTVHFRGRSFFEHPLSSKFGEFCAAIIETPDDGMQAETVHTILVDQRVESVHHEATRLQPSTLKTKSDNIAKNILDESHLVGMPLRCQLRSQSEQPSNIQLPRKHVFQVRIAQEVEQSSLLDEGHHAHKPAPHK